jgi:MFS family permease
VTSQRAKAGGLAEAGHAGHHRVVPGLLVTVAAAATIGDAAAMVTLTIRLYAAEHSGWAIAALLLAILGPSVVLAPLTARILARVSVWRALVVTSAAQAAAAVVLARVTAPGPTLALVVVLGAGLALSQPALLSAVPDLVGPDRLAQANALIRTANWGGWTVGPLIGGVLASAGQAPAALLLEATSFVVAGACFAALSRLSTPGTPAQPTAAPTIRAALGYIRRDAALPGLLLTVGMINICTFITGVAEIFFAREALHAGDTGYAALLSAWSACMIAGNLLAPRAARRTPWGSSRAAGRPPWGASRTALLAVAVTGAGLAAAAAAPSLIAAIGAYGVAGAGFGLQSTLIRTMIQQRAAGPLRTPVCTVWVAVDMGTQLAGYLAGGVALLAGPRAALLAAGAGLCATAVIAAAALWRPVPVPVPSHGRSA